MKSIFDNQKRRKTDFLYLGDEKWETVYRFFSRLVGHIHVKPFAVSPVNVLGKVGMSLLDKLKYVSDFFSTWVHSVGKQSQ